MKAGAFKILLIFSFFMIPFSLCGCSNFQYMIHQITPAKTLTGITSFRYGYSGGTYAYSGCDYTADLKDDRAAVTIRFDGSEAVYSFETDSELMEQLTEIANEYKISSWDGFNKSNNNVLDGDSFTFRLKTDSGQSVDAHGYMSYPKDYREATDRIETLFRGKMEEVIDSEQENAAESIKITLDDLMDTMYWIGKTKEEIGILNDFDENVLSLTGNFLEYPAAGTVCFSGKTADWVALTVEDVTLSDLYNEFEVMYGEPADQRAVEWYLFEAGGTAVYLSQGSEAGFVDVRFSGKTD